MEYNARHIPPVNRVLSFVSGFYNIFGWTFYTFGMIFVIIFVMNADLSTFSPVKYDSQAEGKVRNINSTSITENNRRVFRVIYSFTDMNGTEHISSSYTKKNIKEGTKVRILYSKKDPQLSKVEGMRRAPFGPYILFVLLFPFIGLVFILLGIRKGVRINRLLKYGEITKAALEKTEPTRTRINNRRVYKYTYKYRDKYGENREHIERTHLAYLLNDSKEKELLYIPGIPKYSAIIATIPGNVKVLDGRNLEFNTSNRSLFQVLIPLGGIIITMYVILSITS